MARAHENNKATFNGTADDDVVPDERALSAYRILDPTRDERWYTRPPRAFHRPWALTL